MEHQKIDPEKVICFPFESICLALLSISFKLLPVLLPYLCGSVVSTAMSTKNGKGWICQKKTKQMQNKPNEMKWNALNMLNFVQPREAKSKINELQIGFSREEERQNE